MTDAPLRILHTEASNGWGGQEIRILTESAEFIRRGHTVHLIANEVSEILKAAPDYGVPASAVDLRRKSLSSMLAVRRFIRDWRPDVVNPHSSIDGWMVALARLRLDPRPRVVRTRHLSAAVPRNAASRWLYRRGSDFVMTTGEIIVDQLTADGFLDHAHVDAVPTGIDTDRYSPGDKAEARRMLGLPTAAPLIGIVAAIRSWKGHADLVDAFARLDLPDARLVIVGDGGRGRVEEQVAALGLADRVVFAGRQADVVPWLRSFDVFVLPSYANEGVPQAVLQALACRLPIVSCPVGGIPECTEDLSAVTLVPPRDPPALASAITAVLAAPPDEAALDASRTRVLERYSLETMYRTVLARFRG